MGLIVVALLIGALALNVHTAMESKRIDQLADRVTALENLNQDGGSDA